MEKRILCGDVVPGCKQVLTAPTTDELVKKVAAHAAQAHGITEVTPEIGAAVMAAIKDAD
jgi:predicted small metal-binding protein